MTETQTEIIMENKKEDLEGISPEFFEGVSVLMSKFNQNVDKLADHHGIKVSANTVFKILNERE